MATRPEKGYETEIQKIGKTRLYLNAVSRIHRRRKLSNIGRGQRGYFQCLGGGWGDGAVDIANCEACIGVLGIQAIYHFTSMEYTSTMFNFRDTAIFPPKYRNTD